MNVLAMPEQSLLARISARLAALSISVKLAAVIAMGFLATFSVCFVLITANARTMGLDVQSENKVLVAELLADQMQAPMKFKDGGRLTQIYKPAADNDKSLLRIDILHVSGERLAQFDRGADVQNRLRALIEKAMTGKKLAQDQVDSMNMVAMPVMSRDGGSVLGAVGFVWDNWAFLNSHLTEIRKSVAISALVALVGLICIVLVISRLATRPIKTLSAAMESVSKHDYEAGIPGTGRGDEIGIMASKLAEFRDALVNEKEQESARQRESGLRRKLFLKLGERMSQLASGRTDCQIDVDEFAGLDKSHVEICENFNDVVVNLRDMLSTIVFTAESVRTSSREISDVAEDQSRRSEAQASMLEESAVALEELNNSVQKTAELAAETSNRIADNKKLAAAGGEVVDRTVKAMRDIEESSQQITAIIGVIDDIAFQTNLLALNAGVEAARAGESGRGFAVVASEVRALAQRASDSANKIKSLILRSGEHVTEGSELANQAGVALSDIIDGVNHVSDLVSLIATGSSEQATNLAEIKESVTELDKVTQQNAAVIEEASAASRSLSNEAQRMSDALRRFTVDGDDHGRNETALPIEISGGWGADIAAAEESDAQNSEPAPVFGLRAGSGPVAVNSQEDWHEF